MKIRDAVETDAPEICRLLRQSILALCIEDHRDRPDVLDKWMANKKPELIAAWIQKPKSSMLVAELDGVLISVGGVKDDGEVTLNYVSPNHRFKGISRAMISALEKRARERGATNLSLFSTHTARIFYKSCGYTEKGVVQGPFGIEAYEMHKDKFT